MGSDVFLCKSFKPLFFFTWREIKVGFMNRAGRGISTSITGTRIVNANSLFQLRKRCSQQIKSKRLHTLPSLRTSLLVDTVQKREMPPKKRTRSSKTSADSGEADFSLEVDSGAIPSVKDADKTAGSRRKAAGSVKNGNKDTANTGPEYSHWLMKSEPESRMENGIDVKFGIEDLKALPDQTGCWDGVRNYQARNFMRQMKEGQLAFFYHSNCKEPGIAGLMKIVKEAYVDYTQFDKKDAHYDASSKPENPKWSMVDVQYERMMKRYLPLSELKQHYHQHSTKGGALKSLSLFTRARLSVQPLTKEEFDYILSLEDEEPLV